MFGHTRNITRTSFGYNQGDPLVSRRDETNADSNCTKETFIEANRNDIDTGSGEGPTVCVQRTIARQIRSMERFVNSSWREIALQAQAEFGFQNSPFEILFGSF